MRLNIKVLFSSGRTKRTFGKVSILPSFSVVRRHIFTKKSFQNLKFPIRRSDLRNGNTSTLFFCLQRYAFKSLRLKPQVYQDKISYTVYLGPLLKE